MASANPLTNNFELQNTDADGSIRAKRGHIMNALKGAAVGAIGNKLLGGSARKGALAGAAGGVAVGALNKKYRGGSH